MRKIIYYILLLIFGLFAAVQYNDPDGWLWILVYLSVGYACYRAMLYKGDTINYFLLALLFFLWGANQFPPQWEGVMLDAMGMKTLNIELGREALGLWICSLALVYCAFTSKKSV